MRNIEQRLPSWLIHQFVLLLLVGCQALTSGDSVATIGADLTMYASESDSIRAAVTADGIMAVETVVAASTRVAELSVVNAALGATLRANYTGTPKVEAVVVSAEDMGTSLEDDMMDYTTERRWLQRLRCAFRILPRRQESTPTAAVRAEPSRNLVMILQEST